MIRSEAPLVTRPRKIVAAILATTVLAVACSSQKPPARALGACGDSKSEIEVHFASYDLATGPPSRFIVGLTSQERFVSFGSVGLRFAYCGTKSKPQPGQFGSTATADFLPLPEERGEQRPPPVEGPAVVPASHGRGVYATQAGFDRAGFWRVEVTADIKGVGTRIGTADFPVLGRHKIPFPGNAAIASESLTVASAGAPPAAIDSRAATGEPIPDTELHQVTIAGAIKEGRPAIVVFSTPVYCQSRFCGPVTDMVAALAKDYTNRAAFIHVEIWRDFDNQTLNKAAAEWLLRDDDLTEPWVFLIGADGKITARWDNVATRGEIEPHLLRLPAR